MVVTYNRLPLLREALAALNRQSQPIDQILVVDNASTDGTAEYIAAEFPSATLLRLPENLGSSGGFSAGIRWAFQNGFDWIWTLDDDSIAEPSALAALLKAHESFPQDRKPELLASKVVWTDGSIHPMNLQKPKLYDADTQILAAEHSAMSIRFTSFVSMLVSRGMIEKHGLPIAGYFIWNDDVEYAGRILRDGFGVFVPASVVCHKTARKHVPATSIGGKFYFEVRNKLWILRHSAAFSRGEKWWMAKSLGRRSWRHLLDARFGSASLAGVLRGIFHGMTRKPQADLPANVIRTALRSQRIEARAA